MFNFTTHNMSALQDIIDNNNIEELNSANIDLKGYQHGVLVKSTVVKYIGRDEALDNYLSNKYVIIEEINDSKYINLYNNKIQNSRIEIEKFAIHAAKLLDYFDYTEETNTLSEQRCKFTFVNKLKSVVDVQSYYISWSDTWTVTNGITRKLSHAYMGDIDKINFIHSKRYDDVNKDFKRAVNPILA